MKLKTRLLICTGVLALSAGVAFAAIDGNRLAKDYLEEGYTWVEVKVGPTQTKVEAVKDGRKVEVIYDNATGDIITQENETADDDDLGRTGMQVKTVKKDFEDDEDDDDEDDDEDDDDEDHDDDHDSDHDDDSDDADDN